LNWHRPTRDLAWGTALAAGIGLPGLAFYWLGRRLGITVHIETSTLHKLWWTVPVLIMVAITNGLLEEVIVVAYLVQRLEERGWAIVWIVVTSAVLRGTYHLYQGFGPFIGNAVMGVVMIWWYRRHRRVAPLVIAHSLLDIVAFIGPSLVPTAWLG
jgi:membrane protease YdiL (CAAX protease family)